MSKVTKTGDFDLLSLESQLNVEADNLATQYQSQILHQHETAPMIEGTPCHLQIHVETVGSQHRKAIRDMRRTHDLIQYIQKKTNIDDEASYEVDLDSHKSSVRTFKVYYELPPAVASSREANSIRLHQKFQTWNNLRLP